MPDCLVDVSDGVMTIRFNRPERMNALGGTLLQEFNEAMIAGRADPGVRAFVVTGEGRAWNAGADLQAIGNREGGAPARPDTSHDKHGGVGEAVLNIFHADKPTIAAINGVCAGGGFGLASAFDIRIASDQARFTTVFIKRALAPDCGLSWFLPRLVGQQAAAELFYTGRMVAAEEAKELGLVLKVVPHEQLMDEALAFARDIAKKPPTAMKLTRRAIQRAIDFTLEQQLEFEWTNQKSCLAAPEFAEGVRAFIEKREPDYSKF